MRLLEKRLHRLEVGLLPPAETEESRRLHEIVLENSASARRTTGPSREGRCSSTRVPAGNVAP
jgi:hypothetical protein